MIDKRVTSTLRSMKVTDVAFDFYQRTPNNARVKKIAREFDPTRLGVIKVSLRNGKYYVIDGQHRILACLAAGHSHINAEVFHGLTYEEESLYFYSQRENVTPVSTGQKFKAMVEAKNPDAIKIKETVELSGYKLCYSGGKHSGGIVAFGALQQIYDKFGSEHIFKTLKTIQRTWGNINEATESGMILGVSAFLLEPDYDECTFVKKLSKVEPRIIVREAKSVTAFNAKEKEKPFQVVLRKFYDKGNRK